MTADPFALGAGSGAFSNGFFLGPDGQTWFLSSISVKEGEKLVQVPTLNEITPGGPVVRFQFPAPDPYRPRAAVTGPDGAIWMADPGVNGFDRNQLGGALETVPMPIGLPVEVASLGGAVWSTNITTGAIGEVLPGGKPTEHLVAGGGFGSFGNTEPYGLVVGPDGALWFAEQNHAAIGRITITGEITTFPIPPAPGTIPGQVGAPAPRRITVGPEGAIWFTDPGSNAIGRVAGGIATEYPIPGETEVVPNDIVTVGSELFFTESDATSIGSVNPTAPPVEEAPKIASVHSAEVARALRVANKATKIKMILMAGGYTTTISLPSAGTAVITWRSAHATIALGKATFAAAASKKVQIALTAAGKKLLKKAKTSIKLTAKGTFALNGGSAVTATKTLTLKR